MNDITLYNTLIERTVILTREIIHANRELEQLKRDLREKLLGDYSSPEPAQTRNVFMKIIQPTKD